MTTPGNGKDPGIDIDYTNVILTYVAEMASAIEMGLDEMAASIGEGITYALMEIPASNRAAIYAVAKQAIGSLPDEVQTQAFCYAQITPDEPDPLTALARAVGLSEEEIKESEEETPRPKLISDVPIINPALDYAKGVVYIAQQRTVASEDSTIKSIPVIFTSERDYFLCPQVKQANELRLIANRVAIDKNLERAGQRWSLPAIMEFLEMGGNAVCPWKLYHRLEQLYRERIWFPEVGNYWIFALYTMLSYVYPVFDAVPYLHLTGLPGSGKTHAARLLATLAFNGHVEVDPTEASLFRTIEATRGLVVLDDQETGVTNRRHSENPFMTIMKVGYKRGGMVTRMERRGADFVPQTFDVYCPKVITNVFGLEDILADRTIPILMRGLPPNLDRPINTSPLQSKVSQPIVDDLFLFAMHHTPKISELANEPSQHQNRTEEIFWPLFVLAMYIDIHSSEGAERSLLSELSAILEEKKGEREVIKYDTPEATLRLALLNLLENRGKDDWVSARDIEKEFYKLHSSPPNWYNDRWLGRNIGKVAGLRPQDRKRGTVEETVPRFDYMTGQELDTLETKRFTYYFIRQEAL